MSNETITHSGYIAILGRPNVGKSSLLNAILQEKISITTPKPQTTRWQILGIKSILHAQLIFVDTPGVQHEEKRAMNRYLNRIAQSSMHDADVILFVVEALSFTADDKVVLEKLQKTTHPVILVINKIDLVKDKNQLLPFIEKLQSLFDFTHIIPVSAKNEIQLETLETEIIKLLPEGPAFYPEDQITDKGFRFQIGEIIREKIIMATEEELPYTTSVEIEQIKRMPKQTDIHALIWVERQGQKVIMIGKGGARLKKISTEARIDIEKLLDTKVYLRVWVKVKSNWTDDDRALRGLGYE